MPATPNIANYYIGKGHVYFKKTGDAEFRDLGNVPTLEFTPDLTSLEHFSSREGVRTKDRTVVVEKKGTLRIVAEEWDAQNMALQLLGDISTDTEGRSVIDIFSQNAISGELKFIGTNDVGPKWEFHFLKVDFIPSASISPISDEWGGLEFNAEVAAVNGKFGTATLIAEEGETVSEPNP